MKKILLIEDDPFLIDIYTTKLEQSGFRVEIARDGLKGLEVLKKDSPQLVLLDIVLPQMDGWEVLRKIKQDDKFKDLPVIVLSNLGQKQEVKKGLDLGAVKYLIKAHYTPAQVVEEIKQTLKS